MLKPALIFFHCKSTQQNPLSEFQMQRQILLAAWFVAMLPTVMILMDWIVYVINAEQKQLSENS
jgi:hypothetical protein